jgi:hypothetical protein
MITLGSYGLSENESFIRYMNPIVAKPSYPFDMMDAANQSFCLIINKVYFLMKNEQRKY